MSWLIICYLVVGLVFGVRIVSKSESAQRALAHDRTKFAACFAMTVLGWPWWARMRWRAKHDPEFRRRLVEWSKNRKEERDGN